jgi:integrase
MPVLLAVTTGVRRGELLSIRWVDIDMDARTLIVRRSLQQTSDGISFKEPKTSRGIRSVALPQMTVDSLRRHRSEQARERIGAGPAYQENDWVCCMEDGRPWLPSSLTHAFTSHLSALDLAKVRFHDLGHSHASHLLRQGVHPKVVSERLGHSTVGITLDVYSHLMPGIQEEAAKRIDSALRTAIGEPR